ncbi:MAG: EscU/YscU/HrcU family type III secretion system export apparatus switch protein [Planctomycetaceae bacterium]
MSESPDEFGDRTERPTERRRREARARGEVARSSDIVSSVVLLVTGLALWWIGPWLNAEFAGMMKSGLTTVPAMSADVRSVTSQLQQILIRLAIPGISLLLIIVAAAMAANLVQSGFLWVPGAVLPKLERLNPGRSLSRWWSLNSWFNIIGATVKLVTLLCVLVIFLRTRLTSAGPLIEGSPLVIVNRTTQLLGELVIVLSGSLLVLAVLDYGYQFWSHERRLMMTVEEVRREKRDEERDPHMKHRQREVAISASRSVSPIE